ncbi:hypothetical protein [Streptomyces specialis]|uniref:hypothetical protein n=1 Tax=Streptomyces specialis TaxID=498367 RepID=UPI00073EE5C8|nr:hypothetical protein [Streptomyces specialis]
MKKHTMVGIPALAAAATLAFPPGAAHAADGDVLTATATGARVTVKVDWHNATSFTLRNVVLSDTLCDDDPVYFYTKMSGFQWQSHSNNSGCGSNSALPDLPGSVSGGVPSIWVVVCRNEQLSTDTCGTSASSVNPYYP